MHRVLILMLLLVGLAGASPYFSDEKDNNATGRLLTGKVLDNHDNPLPGAVVHLVNTHTQAVKTYIVRPQAKAKAKPRKTWFVTAKSPQQIDSAEEFVSICYPTMPRYTSPLPSNISNPMRSLPSASSYRASRARIWSRTERRSSSESAK